jgi:hypothetical protein
MIFKFDKPLLIRGYGVRSGNDCPDRDPYYWEFSIVDAIPVLEAGKEEEAFLDWEIVDKREKEIWTDSNKNDKERNVLK